MINGNVFSPSCLLVVMIMGLAAGVGHAAEQPAQFDPTLVSWSAQRAMSIPDPDHGAFVAPPPLVLADNLSGPIFERLRAAQSLLSQESNATPPGRLEGGVSLAYESIRIEADQFDFWQTPLASAAASRAWPRRVYLQSGANGPEPDRVHIDSRQTGLKSMNVKGLLRPKRVTIDRMPVIDSDDTVVFFMLFEHIDRFKVQIRGAKDAWQTVTGDADVLLVELHADQLAQGLSNPRVAAMHLASQTLKGADSAQNQRVQLTYWHPKRPARMNSRVISLYFDTQGRLQRMDAGKDTTMQGLAAGSQAPSGAPYGDHIPVE